MGTDLNLYAAWTGILLGFFAGAVPGLFFQREAWLGGYGSWRRRMIRLAHISFFGLAFINLAFVNTAAHWGVSEAVLLLPSRLLILGAAAMPLICYLAAVRPSFRHLFFVPVLTLVVGVALFLWKGVFP